MESNILNDITHVKSSSKSLPEQVADQIRKLIIERHMKYGEQLPNEFELAESLNVGRGTVREAVKLLVARNCLEIRRGKGTFVAEEVGKINDPLGFEFVPDKVKLAEELYEVRSHFEPWIASLAAKRIQEEEKAELRNLCAAVEEKIRAGEDHGEADTNFHHYIAKVTHNEVLPEILSIVTYSVQLFTRFKEPELLQKTVDMHRAITEAICANNATKAGECMRKHIEANLESIERLKAE